MAYMSIQSMRESLIAIYPFSENWRKKVMSYSDGQVIAVFRRMLIDK